MSSEKTAVAAGVPPPVAKKPYPFWLGGVAASIAGAITHPLDSTKVRLQVTGEKHMINEIKKTVQTYGIRGLYDGSTGTSLRQMTYSMMRFAAYDQVKGSMHKEAGPPPAWKMGVAGSIAGGIAGTLGNPAESMMVRMQADRAKPPAQRYNYRNSVQGSYRMAVDEGIASWFRGVGPNSLRSVLMNASQLGAYDWFKSQLQRFMQDGPALHFLASFGAGTFATTVCSPADVLKSRIMNASNNEGVAQVLKTGLAKDGPLFLFKGWTPAWIRLTPTTILIFLTLEQLKAGVDRYRKAGGTLL